MNSSHLKRRLALAALLCLCLSLAGCFDVELRLNLAADGKGGFSTTLIGPAALVDKVGDQSLGLLVEPAPQRTLTTKGRRFFLTESAPFPRLDRLTTRQCRFKIETVLSGMLDMTDATYRITATVMPSPEYVSSRAYQPGMELEETRPEARRMTKGQERAAHLLHTALDGYYVTVTLVFPGKAIKARSAVVEGMNVDPVLQDNGSAVSWRIPLWHLVASNARHATIFTVDFKGEFDMPEVLNDKEERVPVKMVQSHLAGKSATEGELEGQPPREPGQPPTMGQ